jgi:hypothetical protein
MLMLFTEELVKLSQLPENSIMLVNLPLNQDYKNQFSYVILLAQLMLWVVYILVSIKEEDKLSKKCN